MLNHNYIGTEHILLGLVSDGEGVAAKALDSLRISLPEVRRLVEEIVGRGKAPPTGHIPFTPRAKKVLELSLRESRNLGHNYIGTEHILLGLIREGEGVGAQVLMKLGADLNRARQRVIDLLSGAHPEPPMESVMHGPFTDEAHRVLALARDSARDLGHAAIEPADILLGLIVTDDARTWNLLGSWGVDMAAVRRRIDELAAEEEKEAGGETPEAAEH